MEAFRGAVREPAAAQAQALQRVLEAARGTRFAAEHGLETVRSLSDYRAAVPVRSYDDHRHLYEAVAAGERRVVTRQRVLSLVKTSGTTGAPKLLPVTSTWARIVADAQALWVIAMVREQEEVTTGKSLIAVGPAVEGRTAGGLRYGSNTGRMAVAQPWLVKRRYAVPYFIHTLPDPEVRRYCLLRIALSADVRTWTTANPSTLLATCRSLQTWREPLTRDLHDGTLRSGPAAALPALTRLRLWTRLGQRRVPDGPWHLGRWWNLACINCWKGGAAPFFLDRLAAAMGATVPVREAGISASEGYFALPLHSSWTGGVAYANGHLLELAPEGGGDIVSLHEAEVGREYRLIVSTTSGLYRYDLNDVVRVVGHMGRTPLLTFLRKGRDVLSVTGEKVTAGQVVQAMREAAPGAHGFTVGVELAEIPTYVACVAGIDPSSADAVGAALERSLCTLNVEYASKRETDRLRPLRCVVVDDDTFDRFRAERLRHGTAEGQVKDPVLVHGHDLDRMLGGWR